MALRWLVVLLLLNAANVALPPAASQDCLLAPPAGPSHLPTCWNRDPSVTTPVLGAGSSDPTPRFRDVRYCATFTDPDGDQMWATMDWGGRTKTILTASGFTWCERIQWTVSGVFCVRASAHDTYQRPLGPNQLNPEIVSGCLTVHIGSPPATPTVTGPGELAVGAAGSFCAQAADPDNDFVQYVFAFGDGATGTTPSAPSGSARCLPHAFASPGEHCVRAYAQDLIVPASPWSSCLWVEVR